MRTVKNKDEEAGRRTARIYSGKLYPWQQDAAKYLLRFSKKAILTILSPRQTGKTHFITMFSLAQTVNRNNYRVVIINPTFANSKRTYADLERYVEKFPAGVVKSKNASDLQIEFLNGSAIQLKSFQQKAALRGDHCNLLIIDEAAFVDTDTAMSLVFPYVNATNGDIVMISTPTFKDETNLFYKFYKLSKENKKDPYIQLRDWSRYDLSPVMPPDRKQLLKETMAYNIYLNEVLGEFLTEKSDLWDIKPVLRNGILPTKRMFAGLDWGSKGTDETVLSVFNEHRQMYRLVRLTRETSPTEQVQVILNIIKELGIEKVVYEANSIGYPMSDYMKKEAARQHIRCRFIPFETTNDSKRRIIENLQLYIQNQQITLLDDNQLKLEFVHFTIKSTPSGKITYENDDPRNHDDIVISTALALSGEEKGTYAVR